MEIALLAVAVIAILALAAYVVFVQPRAEAARSTELFAQLERDRAAHEQRAGEPPARDAAAPSPRSRLKAFLGMAKSHLKQESELGQQALQAAPGEIDKGLDNFRKELTERP